MKLSFVVLPSKDVDAAEVDSGILKKGQYTATWNQASAEVLFKDAKQVPRFSSRMQSKCRRSPQGCNATEVDLDQVVEQVTKVSARAPSSCQRPRQ